MLSRFLKFFAVGLILTIAAPLPLVAEQPARSQNSLDPPYLRHPPPLTQSSGYIFAGTVQSVQRTAPNRNGVATVQISFHVDQGIRGVRTGQTLAIREWAGLWEAGERYRQGERVLLFLYPPSKLGLTSPVRGPMGRFRIGTDGQVVFDPGRIGFPARRPSIGDPGQTRFNPREFVRFVRSAEEE
jgi:hypothetical protein